MSKYYAGIGSRKTPQEILDLMVHIAKQLRHDGWILRSGGAQGADSAFELGALNKTEIFSAADATDTAIYLASLNHPAWEKCNNYARKLHGRNSMILLGKDLKTPVKFVICWTPDAQVTGGSGLALRIAKSRNIPVFNLAKQQDFDRLNVFVSPKEEDFDAN